MDIETKHYGDGTTATGTPPLPDVSPRQQLIRDLRERVVCHPRLMTDAADEIERLQAENARLIAEGTRRLEWMIGLADHAATLGRCYAKDWHIKRETDDG